MTFKSGLFKDIKIEPSGDNTEFLIKLAACTEDFLTGEVWPQGVNKLLKLLGEHFQVSRVWVFQLMNLTDTHITQDYIFEWASKPEFIQIGMSKFSKFTNELGSSEYRRIMNSRQRGEWQSVIVERLPTDFLRIDTASQGILSMLTVPLFVNGRWWGILGYDDCERKHEWTDSEIAFLRLAGTLLESLILKNQLAAQEKQFSALSSIKESGLWSLDIKTWHIRFTSGISDIPLTQETTAEYSFRDLLKIVHPEDRTRISDLFRNAGLSDKSIRQDIRLFKNDGNYKWVEIIGNAHFDPSGTPTMMAGVMVDILDRKKTEEKLLTEATKDPLTGVLNRRAFSERLDSFISLSQRNKRPFSILMIDIDHFKLVNDRYGHSTGDEVLKAFVRMVYQKLRKEDVFARYGGEEFVVLLSDTDSEGAEIFGGRIRSFIENNPCVTEPEHISITISIGCSAYYGDREITSETLINSADSALYRAKQSGRNTLCCLPLRIK